jgi:hypothetical protein
MLPIHGSNEANLHLLVDHGKVWQDVLSMYLVGLDCHASRVLAGVS